MRAGGGAGVRELGLERSLLHWVGVSVTLLLHCFPLSGTPGLPSQLLRPVYVGKCWQKLSKLSKLSLSGTAAPSIWVHCRGNFVTLFQNNWRLRLESK